MVPSVNQYEIKIHWKVGVSGMRVGTHHDRHFGLSGHVSSPRVHSMIYGSISSFNIKLNFPKVYIILEYSYGQGSHFHHIA